MTRRRLTLSAATLVGVALLLLLTAVPVAAAGYDSTTEALVRTLHRKLLVVAVFFALVTQFALFFAAVKFHGNDDPKPTADNRNLEIAWTVGVAVVLLFVGASSYMVLANPAVSSMSTAGQAPNDNLEVHIVGQEWFWAFDYPEAHVTTTNTLVVPTNRTILFTVTSKDVVHSVHVPGLGLKQDAIPGQRNTIRTRLTDTGTYRLYCAEFCGAGHSKMLATVRVVTPSEYRRWIDRQQRTGNETTVNSTPATETPTPSTSGNSSGRLRPAPQPKFDDNSEK